MPRNNNTSHQVSKTMAQSKIRKQRASRGVSNPNQYENNFNSQDYSILNHTAISHDRNQSLQNTTPGAINMSQYSQNESFNPVINANRKPTADSAAYTLYKPNAKGNTRGGKVSSGDSVDNEPDNYQNSIDKQSSYNTGPNTTASRFYNPNKASAGGYSTNEQNSRFI
jgi:hypothetical protein